MYKLYCLKDPSTDRIRYVGVTKISLPRRLDAHNKSLSKERNHRTYWVPSLREKGLRPTIHLIAKYATLDQVYEAEIKTIACYRRLGLDLVNSCGGGKGVNNPTEKVIEKMRQRMLGKRFPPEFGEKVRQSKLGKKRPQHVIEALRKAATGRPYPEHMKLKLSKKVACSNGIEYPSIIEASRQLNISRQYIRKCIKDGRISIYGLTFKSVSSSTIKPK